MVVHRHGQEPLFVRLLQSLRVQILVLIVLTVVMPFFANGFRVGIDAPITRNSVLALFIPAVIGTLLLRRLAAYPGEGVFAYIMPVHALTFGIALTVLLLARLDYSGGMLVIGFGCVLAHAFATAVLLEKRSVGRFHVVPGGTADLLETETTRFEWIPMEEPRLPDLRNSAIVANLDWDHSPEWERMLAEAALNGHAVFHVKQLRESLTGRVQIEHLSENLAGSLLPNVAWRKVKHGLDVVLCLLVLPLVVLIGIVIAVAIRLEDGGPALFRHARVGKGGRHFTMLKFRTMREREVADTPDARRQDAMTRSDDERITKVGRFLRRTRLDELPQVWNVLCGHMSLIGPRPEAVALAQWYEGELPFYMYRFIVRPGLTGWAQINQGHVAELEDAHLKLNYDFFYIKHFSAWLDIVIAIRTVGIVLFGKGWR